MKIRNGFISNSSTSSYIIALKQPLKEDPYKARNKILEHLGLNGDVIVNKDSQIWKLLARIGEMFLHDGELFCYNSLEELEDAYYVGDEEREKLKDFKYFYYGHMSTDGENPIEWLIMDYIKVYIDDEEMYMKFDGMF